MFTVRSPKLDGSLKNMNVERQLVINSNGGIIEKPYDWQFYRKENNTKSERVNEIESERDREIDREIGREGQRDLERIERQGLK